MLVNILGNGGSGKTTLVDKLICNHSELFTKLITYTSRPKRSGEIDGVDYYFVNSDFFQNNTTILQRIGESGCYYGTKVTDIDQLLKQNKLILTAFNPKGIIELEKMGYQIVVFRLATPAWVSLYRMIRRDKQILESIKRLLHDRKTMELTGIKSTIITLEHGDVSVLAKTVTNKLQSLQRR